MNNSYMVSKDALVARFFLILDLLWALAAPLAMLSQTVPAGTVVMETIHSKALEGNLLGDSADRGFTVYLPPTYQKGESRYPAVYLLHGAMDTYKAWTEYPEWANIPKIMDKLIASGKIHEMVVVMPDGDNRFGVPAYTNSVTTGNWEDYITKDLVNYVDSKYRTLPRAASRGIAGHEAPRDLWRRVCAQRTLPGMGQWLVSRQPVLGESPELQKYG